jgi:hypothetical protein
MQLSFEFFTKNIPAYDDPKLGQRLQGVAWQEGDMPLVEWNNPRAVDRLGYYMQLNPQLLALHQPCLYLTGSGLCPLCRFPYGSKLICNICMEYRDHFQVVASEITFLSSGTLKNDFGVVLEHLLLVGTEARNLIMSETTARVLSAGGPVVMFRGHARLQPGNQPGVNAVARNTPELPRYLSFARSTATLDSDPHFGFLWYDFLRALSSGRLPLVNPRPAVFEVEPVFGPGPVAMPMGRVVPAENPVPLVNLDAAAAVVNNFVAAWEDHHGLAIRDGRVFQLQEGPVARAEAPPAAQHALLVQDGAVPLPFANVGMAQAPAAPQPAAVAQNGAQPAVRPLAPPIAVGHLGLQAPSVEQLLQMQQQIAQQLQQLQELQRQQFLHHRNMYLDQQVAHHGHVAVPQVQQMPQNAVFQPVAMGQASYPHQPASDNVLNVHVPTQNVFGLQDFSYFPPTYTMNTTSAAQLGKFSTIAGATNTWTRRAGASFPLKVQSYPRGNADGSDGKTRSRVFDIPYASDVITEQYALITDAPVQLMQRENILECYIANCRAWSQYILPLVGGDPRRLPIFGGSLKDVLANIHQLAVGFGTQECVVMRVCHLISVQNVTSCLTPGDSHTLLNPLDISSNYFQGALTKMIAEQSRNRAPPVQQQGVRRQLAVDGDPPMRQDGRQRQRGNAPVSAQVVLIPASNRPGDAGLAQNNPTTPVPWNCCRKFWYGEACFIHQAGQPCRYRHCCRICQVVVTAAEAPAHLRSHIL